MLTPPATSTPAVTAGLRWPPLYKEEMRERILFLWDELVCEYGIYYYVQECQLVYTSMCSTTCPHHVTLVMTTMLLYSVCVCVCMHACMYILHAYAHNHPETAHVANAIQSYECDKVSA